MQGIIGESLKGAVLEIFGKTYNIFAESISAKKPAEQHVFDGKGLTVGSCLLSQCVN